jgi:hypothetical protein
LNAPKNGLISSKSSLCQFDENHERSVLKVFKTDSQHEIAADFISSQYFMTKTATAITAPIAKIKSPIGEVKKASAAPKASVTMLATVQKR